MTIEIMMLKVMLMMTIKITYMFCDERSQSNNDENPPQIKKPPQVSEVIDLTARRPGQGEQKSHPSNWGI